MMALLSGLFQPMGIFLFGIGGGFLIPILHRLGKPWLHGGFALFLLGLTLSSLVPLLVVLRDGVPLEILTAGATPPLAINLRFGLAEGAVAASVNVVACLLAMALWDRLRGNHVALLLFLILTMGINGMILTRDAFNLFVFLEIVSIGTYGLLGLGTSRAAVQAAMKYVMATVIASMVFLLGTGLIYQATGHLNIDLLLAGRDALGAPIAAVGVALMLGCLLLELKPFPANGWALDVYETAPPALAAFLSVCASAGMIFAFAKLLPLFPDYLGFITASAALTFLLSNLIGLRQDSPGRLLGYSSIGQMALLVLALAVLTGMGAEDALPFVVFGLFVNHLLSKAGLFVLAGALGPGGVGIARGLGRRPGLAVLLALFVIAICGLPPFPGFWAKWDLVMHLAMDGRTGLIAVVLAGSLLEAAYLFRWFLRALAPNDDHAFPPTPAHVMVPLVALAALLMISGLACAILTGTATPVTLAPLAVGAALATLGQVVRGRVLGAVTLATIAATGWWLPMPDGIPGLFAPLLLAGGLVIALSGLAQDAPGRLQYPMLAVLLLALQAVLRVETGLEFYLAWEFVALAAFFLITQRPQALNPALMFLMFSLVAAFLLLAGFAQLAALSGTQVLAGLQLAHPAALPGLVLMAAGLLVKGAALGPHVWLPEAHAEAPGEVSAQLSAVVTKGAMFGLLAGGYAVIRAGGVDFSHALAWIGMATTLGGALMALAQTDAKRLLAYSSMSQLGYIVLAIALMGHLGWVTALYVVANHMLVKGILFLAVAGVVLRTGTRRLDGWGGLAGAMPLTCATVTIALLAMAGLPPLMGFGGKWLLLSALVEKGWTGLAVAGAVATFLGLWYMLRLFAAMVMGPPDSSPARLGEAPALLLFPQVLLVVGIGVMTFLPKTLMGPVSAAIDPDFAATLVWEGRSLEAIYAAWWPMPTMLAALGASMVLAVVWLAVGLTGRTATGLRAVLVTARPLPAWAMPPLAMRGWAGMWRAAHDAADGARRVYSGDGQVYLMLVLGYILAVFAAGHFAAY